MLNRAAYFDFVSLVHDSIPWFRTNKLTRDLYCKAFFGGFKQGILKGGSITLLLTSCLTGLESAVYQLTIFVVICTTD
jgi:hypothetical protein